VNLQENQRKMNEMIMSEPHGALILRNLVLDEQGMCMMISAKLEVD
jgi:hypothetical protein